MLNLLYRFKKEHVLRQSLTMFISMMMFVPMMPRKPLLNAKFALRMVSFEQKVADNLFYQEHLLSEPARLQRTDANAWKMENLRTGAEVAVNGLSLTVLNRPTNYLCVVQEKNERPGVYRSHSQLATCRQSVKSSSTERASDPSRLL